MLGKLDAVMHQYGTSGFEVSELIRWYDEQLRQVLEVARQHYENVDFYVFSDHGMHDVTKEYDMLADIDKLGLEFNKDYVAIYDSTMARFWYLNDKARSAINGLLEKSPHGRFMSDEELEKEGCYFEDSQFGDAIFLMNSGSVITPCFMGKKSCPGMHGYHPDDAETDAAILSNRKLPEELKEIKDIFWLLLDEAGIERPAHPNKAPFAPMPREPAEA